jgi:hypothetical protein
VYLIASLPANTPSLSDGCATAISSSPR